MTTTPRFVKKRRSRKEKTSERVSRAPASRPMPSLQKRVKSLLYAQDALDTHPEIEEFRTQYLPNGLLSLTEVERWVRETAAKDNPVSFIETAIHTGLIKFEEETGLRYVDKASLPERLIIKVVTNGLYFPFGKQRAGGVIPFPPMVSWIDCG